MAQKGRQLKDTLVNESSWKDLESSENDESHYEFMCNPKFS